MYSIDIINCLYHEIMYSELDGAFDFLIID